ncbi:uncharacterized protein LOC123551960 isoform X3 [Mercenaria mercenaria]|uniref:uncharacterized protein LOC123551960 isoform X3 n=1 Tax=Mercenaria mercenaria TaxID=6596 RepID=UPI00234EEFB4|nr:uncharacterized protein LOC123551960 isoform X3 [Mercenaria mercenaria]
MQFAFSTPLFVFWQVQMEGSEFWEQATCSIYPSIPRIDNEDKKENIKVMDKVQSDEIPNVKFPPDDKSTMLYGDHAPSMFKNKGPGCMTFLSSLYSIISDPDFLKTLEHLIKEDHAPSLFDNKVPGCTTILSRLYSIINDPDFLKTLEHLITGNHAPSLFDNKVPGCTTFLSSLYSIINDPDFLKTLEHLITGDHAPAIFKNKLPGCMPLSSLCSIFIHPDFLKTLEYLITVSVQEFLFQLTLLAILLDKAAKVKYLTKPGRNRGICLKVFLLSNEGAHAYNGNGAFFGKPRRQKYIPLMEHGEPEPGFEVNRIVVYKPTYIYCNT